MFSLSYSSTATYAFTNEDLFALLVHARAANARSQITGALLYRNGRFIQVLEGPEDFVRATFASVLIDARHRVDHSTSEFTAVRRFAAWHMSYSELDDSVTGGDFLADGELDPGAIFANLPRGIKNKEAVFDRLYEQWMAANSQAPQQIEDPNASWWPPTSCPSQTLSMAGIPSKTLISSSGVVAAVFDIVMHDVDTGLLRPVDRVNDKSLAAQLGVSRTPVREALQKLRDLGVVEVAASRFTRIAVIEPRESRQLITVLAALYGAMLDEVIGHTSPAAVELLRLGQAAVVVAIADGESAAAAKAVVEFFLILVDESRNPALIKQIRSLAHVFKLASAQLDDLVGYETILNASEALIVATDRGDIDGAQRALRSLTERTSQCALSSVSVSVSAPAAADWAI